MKCFPTTLACACLLTLFHGAVEAEEQTSSAGTTIKLAEPQRPPTIVVSDHLEEQVRYAVEDLQHYLRVITGKEIAVARLRRSTRQGVPIYLGNLPANEDLKAVINTRKLGRECFVLDVSAKGVRIFGGSKFGMAYGVCELLERLGVRWLFPGQWGEVVPHKKTLPRDAGRFTDKPVLNTGKCPVWHRFADPRDRRKKMEKNLPRARHGGAPDIKMGSQICLERFQAQPKWEIPDQ